MWVAGEVLDVAPKTDTALSAAVVVAVQTVSAAVLVIADVSERG